MFRVAVEGSGSKGRIRTDGVRDLQSLALDLSATVALFGYSPQIRTATSGFGDRHATVNIRE